LYYAGDGKFIKFDCISATQIDIITSNLKRELYNIINHDILHNKILILKSAPMILFRNEYVIVADNTDVHIYDSIKNDVHCFNGYQITKAHYPITSANVCRYTLLNNNLIVMENATDIVVYNLVSRDENRISKIVEGLLCDVNMRFKYNLIIANFTKAPFKKSIVYKITIDGDNDEYRCCVCYKFTERKQILVPCGHTQYCKVCIRGLKTCRVCKIKIKQVIQKLI
jgi:hypothetical protein